MKVNMTPRQLLEWIKAGIIRGNYVAAVALIDDALAQLPEDTTFSAPIAEDREAQTVGADPLVSDGEKQNP